MTLSEIEKTIASLPPEQLAEFRLWFEKFEANTWDAQLQRDAQGGKLDRLAAQAIADFEQGDCKEL